MTSAATVGIPSALLFFPADDKEILLKQKREKRFKRDAGLNDALLVYNENVSIDSHRSFTRLFCISYGWNTPLD
jgi:hypothetical protein